MSKETYTPWNRAELLGDGEAVVEYLRAALEENDPAFFVKAIGNVARAKGGGAVRIGGDSKNAGGDRVATLRADRDAMEAWADRLMA